MAESKTCAWCRGPIPGTLRADAICCSVRCRQARHRFVSGVGVPVARGHGESLRLAYADPPYPGLSKRYYGDHPDFAGEVDHPELIRSLSTYDGWALSTSARALPEILASCPPGVRVAAWHRGDRPTRSAGPLSAWEPVVYWGGRVAVDSSTRSAEQLAADSDASRRAAADASRSPATTTRRASTPDASPSAGAPRRIDSLIYTARPRRTDPFRVVGAKPAVFCRWIFDLLGAQPHDEFTDVFPGSGGVQRAWDVFASGALLSKGTS
jgi:hypothetical protein